jgi:hypothetical protein
MAINMETAVSELKGVWFILGDIYLWRIEYEYITPHKNLKRGYLF